MESEHIKVPRPNRYNIVPKHISMSKSSVIAEHYQKTKIQGVRVGHGWIFIFQGTIREYLI
jgi:hypothetical protein